MYPGLEPGAFATGKQRAAIAPAHRRVLSGLLNRIQKVTELRRLRLVILERASSSLLGDKELIFCVVRPWCITPFPAESGC